MFFFCRMQLDIMCVEPSRAREQVRISTATSTSPVFEYLRRFLEITFVVVVLYAIVKVIPTLRSASSAGGGGGTDMSSIASRQLSTLMINMQVGARRTISAEDSRVFA